ncbi:MAG: peptidoglycan editing factor PgeF [Arcicella sp.]|jgi:polyphenol oxidase|nr:peptidoglycan editing factor PgeF [Arcicella sp.]
MYTEPNIFKQFPELIAVESNRKDGVSPPPYSSLNLGLFTNDIPENIEKNRNIFFSNLGIRKSRVAHSYQIHKDHILKVTRCKAYEGYDALITENRNTFLTVTIADCTPILIYDAKNQAVAAVHAGWKGTVLDITAKTIQRMQLEFKTNPLDCYVYVGTCIDDTNFEVGEEVAEQFSIEFKRLDKSSRKPKFYVDLKKANVAQLLKCGVPENQIEVSPFSTVINNDEYFSHRKEKGKTGRMVALIGMKK